MSEPTTEPVTDPEVKPEGDPAVDPATDPQTDPKADPKVESEAELPEHWRKELTKVRGEAANYRTQLREAQKSLSEAKTPEDFEAARTEFDTKLAELEAEVAVANVARKYEIPDELLPLLKGKPVGELEDIAKTLQKYAAPAAPEHLSGGLTPDEDDDTFDPAEVARTARRSRY